MNAKLKEPSWLKGVLNRGEQTQPYHFETGETERVLPKDLNVLAQAVAQANNKVELSRAVLEDAKEHEKQVNIVARNEVVASEVDLHKAEIAFENANKAFWERANEAMGLPK